MSEQFLPENQPEPEPGSMPGTSDLPAVIEPQAKEGAAPGPVGPLWLGTAAFLRQQISLPHLPQAFLAVIAMISPQVEEPLSLLIAGEPGTEPERFLATINSLMPTDLVLEFNRLNRQTLEQKPALLQEKVVVAYDVSALKAGREILRSLLIRGAAVNHQPIRHSGRLEVDRVQFQGPTSVVALVDLPEPAWLQTLPALRVRLEMEAEFVQQELERRKRQPRGEIPPEFHKILAKEFQNLRRQPVVIPFFDQISDCRNQQDPQILQKLTLIERLLKVVTMINRATFATEEEVMCGYYGIDPAQIPNWSARREDRKLLPGAHPAEASTAAQGLTATKVEYFIFHKIAGRLFAFDDNRLTSRQVRVFNAIKEINLGFLFSGNLLISETAREKELIQILDAQPDLRGWASIHDIMEYLQRETEAPHLSRSTVDREIDALRQEKVIIQKKDPQAPNKFRYRLDTLEVALQTELPHPAAIIDPVYGGDSVQVTDLLTGEVETI